MVGMSHRRTFPCLLLVFWVAAAPATFCYGFLNVHERVFRINRPLQPLLSRSSLLAATSEDLSSYFTVESSNDGPGGGVVHTLTIHKLPGQEEEPEEDEGDSDDDKTASTAETDTDTAATDSDDDSSVNGEKGEEESDTSASTSNTTAERFVAEPPITIQTGRIGRQAAGAITLTRGDTVLYSTAARDSKPKEEIDFLPLSVEHQERFSSAGLTSGAYNKRDGRPAEHEVLVCRLIDRPLRPLIAEGWRHETQLLNWVLSYDGIRSCDPLAITASATALYLSDVPITKPVAAVMVGYNKDKDKLILNPTHKQMETSQLQLIVAGTKDAVLMIEGAADFLPEETMIKAVTFGHTAIQTICEAVEELGKNLDIVKNFETIKPPIEGLQERVDALMTERVDAMYTMEGAKAEQGQVMSALSKAVVEELEEEYPDETTSIKGAFKSLLRRRMFALAKNKGVRCDGRKFDDIRRLDMEAGFLPRVHGSALFTRGETQALATATLGGSGMKQKIDKLDGTEQKRFYLQYTFPPSCVGETGRVGAPGRREIGHGNLAERCVLFLSFSLIFRSKRLRIFLANTIATDFFSSLKGSIAGATH